MFKWLFPLLFLTAAGAARAQPPSTPLYDPQGRLIPYDASNPNTIEAPRPASKPKATGKKRNSKAKASAAAAGAGKAKKGRNKGAKQTRAKKPATKASSQKKRAR